MINLFQYFPDEKKLLELQLPNPAEQADNLILYLGKILLNNFKDLDLKSNDKLLICSIIGCMYEENLSYLLYELSKIELVNFSTPQIERGNTRPLDKYLVGLTFEGWQKYEELKKDHSESKQVFMAMAYGNKVLKDIFENYLVGKFKDDLGLTLVRLIDKPKDGIIDNHLRVEIRKSCLLIADLTDDNYGAYWEAGYAEGLDKLVIYFCEKTKFDKEKTHFDTSHLQTIPWEKDNIEEAYKKLKNLIRVILPDKAKMEDKE
ncbi:MAG: hypothetical protein KAS62_00700 [Candidatus Delongbacteria bacterium]|nr:hypothetical protein [Candidatus Delongbacteria bacterium]